MYVTDIDMDKNDNNCKVGTINMHVQNIQADSWRVHGGFMADSWRIHGGFMVNGFAKVDNGFGHEKW